MKHRYHLGRKLAALTLVFVVSVSSAQAFELRVSSPDGLALSAEVFSENEAFEGVYVASVPSQLDAEVSLGARTLRAGDVLDRSMLSQLLVLPAENRDASCELVYCPIEGGEVQPSRALELSILTGKNEAPVCRDVKFETYKNIANTGVLSASDPEGDTLTYQLVKEPKRGTVDIAPDGSFTYTPAQNKVGKDVFTYTATDSAGNVSNVANVTVKIVKPTDKAMYQDLAGDTLAYTAMWLKDRGVYTGKRIAGNLCFEPEGTLTRGEFLVMAMKLLGAEPESARLTSGFADESKTPAWMRPYIGRHQPGRHGLPPIVQPHARRGCRDAAEYSGSAAVAGGCRFLGGLRCPRLGAGIRLGAGKRRDFDSRYNVRRESDAARGGRAAV